jgi:hypothetical protein
MKLRIKGNSLRLRLTIHEIEELGKNDLVNAHILFPSGRLDYEIKAYDHNYISADFMIDKITVYIPKSQMREWVETDLVSLKGEVSTLQGSTTILLEKDFQCLMTRKGEDESALYPNPLAKHEHKK